MSRSTVALTLPLFATGCAAVLVMAGCAETDALATPVAQTCGARADVAAAFEQDFVAGELDSVRLGACGEVTWRDGDAVSRMAPDFLEPHQLTADALSVTMSASGDQMLSTRADGVAEWRAVDAPERAVELEAERYGFVRDEEESLAWFCGEQSLGTVGPDGVVVQTRTGNCTIWAAEAAPVLAFVDADFALSVIDLSSGDITSMAEVPFVAAGSDQVRLSRDGRMLFHQPANSPVNRIAVFDVERREGERLLGAPETNRGIGALRHAPRAGHTAMFQGAEGFYVVSPNGYLNVYADMAFLSLSPDGAEVAMVSEATNVRGGFDVLLSDLDRGTLRALESAGPLGAAVLPNSTRVSWDGNAVVAEGRNPAFGQRSHRMTFRWDTLAFAQVDYSTGFSRAVWVSESGAVLVGYDDGSAELGPILQPALHRWSAVSVSVATPLSGDRVLLRMRSEDPSECVLLASTSSGASQEVGSFLGLRTVMVDHDGARLVTVSDEPDESIPAGLVSRFVARAMPVLP